jgi:hypothetical protein
VVFFYTSRLPIYGRLLDSGLVQRLNTYLCLTVTAASHKNEFFKLCVEVTTKRDSRNALRSSEAEGLKRTATEIRRLRLF